jgi:hypothetical protein
MRTQCLALLALFLFPSMTAAETICLEGTVMNCTYWYWACISASYHVDGDTTACEITKPPYCETPYGVTFVLSSSPDHAWATDDSLESGLFLWVFNGGVAAQYGYDYAILKIAGESQPVGFIAATGEGELSVDDPDMRLDLEFWCLSPVQDTFLVGQFLFEETAPDAGTGAAWSGVNQLYR